MFVNIEAPRSEVPESRVHHFPQHFLYFLALPHGHGSFLPIFGSRRGLRGNVVGVQIWNCKRHTSRARGQLFWAGILPLKRSPPLHFSDGICNQMLPVAPPLFGCGSIPLDSLKARKHGVNQTLGENLPHLL